jgi:hypothetical protein
MGYELSTEELREAFAIDNIQVVKNVKCSTQQWNRVRCNYSSLHPELSSNLIR